MSKNETIIGFDEVSFEYGHNHPILNEASFSVRRGMKATLMGQNGAGKTTIFQLITGAAGSQTGGLKPDSGKINIGPDLSIAAARQVIPRDRMNLTVGEFFEKCFSKKIYDINPKIDAVLEAVNLRAPRDKIVGAFSGGQQARLLLASALIQNPDILLLDEPTNNLDKAGIEHLTRFLIDYKNTVIVISHDADFLNAFTHGVLYLDAMTRKVEQYAGDYFDVIKEISARIERENKKNAQLAKEIQENKDKANFFANKGGKMRLVAKRMRTKAEEFEEAKVDVRKEDKTIRPFSIPAQNGLAGEVVRVNSFIIINKNHKPVVRKANIALRRGERLLLRGPNGIGKSTLLESIATSRESRTACPPKRRDGKETAKSAAIAEGVKVGYYRQDFSTLNFEDTVYDSLMSVMEKKDEHYMRSVAAGFLIKADIIHSKISKLSEGQKGLVAFARLALQEPGLLILDEPTNHINFRHIPVIAEALNKYEGAMILVSHVPDFVNKIRVDEILDLEK